MKFKTIITREDEYLIDIDESIWDEKALKNFSSIITKVDDVEDLARYLSKSIMRLGSDDFIEGLGYIKTINEEGYELNDYLIRYNKTDYCKGILVTIIEEDEDYIEDVEQII